ncbi:MAG: DUF2007 domain-containing protein [Anaerolineales bacterium]|nr:DUF2007 domain-containing protein [Anaerolineales bacterium]
MVDEEWVVVDKVAGHLQAEILRGALEAQGVQVWLNQEGAGVAYGLAVGPMGEVEILVPSSQADLALHILSEYYAGELEDEGDQNYEDGAPED